MPEIEIEPLARERYSGAAPEVRDGGARAGLGWTGLGRLGAHRRGVGQFGRLVRSLGGGGEGTGKGG